MKTTGNTVFITGGGSGIGRGLAEALHQAGNQVIISGRRSNVLDEVTAANPGMKSVLLNIEDPASIAAVAKQVVSENPSLNVLINNAGIMKPDTVEGELDDALLTSTIQTNLYGVLRMTSALIGHLKTRPDAAIITTTSGLAFTPLAMTAVYCMTKAALHSYIMSLRYKLKGTSVKVIELAPPYVQTELMGPGMKVDPRAMPLDEFIAEVMTLLATDADEILVERVKQLRNNVGPNEYAFFNQLNDMMSGGH